MNQVGNVSSIPSNWLNTSCFPSRRNSPDAIACSIVRSLRCRRSSIDLVKVSIASDFGLASGKWFSTPFFTSSVYWRFRSVRFTVSTRCLPAAFGPFSLTAM
ncbi:hypothetical protein D9M70_522750 [compost metagenome]